MVGALSSSLMVIVCWLGLPKVALTGSPRLTTIVSVRSYRLSLVT